MLSNGPGIGELPEIYLSLESHGRHRDTESLERCVRSPEKEGTTGMH